jgi:hypothetical protein
MREKYNMASEYKNTEGKKRKQKYKMGAMSKEVANTI